MRLVEGWYWGDAVSGGLVLGDAVSGGLVLGGCG